MAPLLTIDLYPAVRAAIDLDVDATVIPDAVIELPIYAGAAELDVLRIDPLAATREGVQLARIQNALVYFTAARLIGAWSQITDETTPDGHQYKLASRNLKERADELRSLAATELDAVLAVPDDGTRPAPVFFALASPRRTFMNGGS